MSLDEETVQEAEEKWDDDEQHQGRQIAKDEDQHESSFDATRRIEALRAFRSAEAVAMVAQDHERTATEITGSLKIGRDTSEGAQFDGLGLAGKRWK